MYDSLCDSRLFCFVRLSKSFFRVLHGNHSRMKSCCLFVCLFVCRFIIALCSLRRAPPILTGISKSAIRVKTGDSNGEAEDRSFNFIVFGAHPVSEPGNKLRARILPPPLFFYLFFIFYFFFFFLYLFIYLLLLFFNLYTQQSTNFFILESS
jgi:hypothetical protein